MRLAVLLRRCSILLGVVALLGLASANATALNANPAPEAALGLRLTEIPAGAQDDPRARLYVIDHVAPGTTITRDIEVSNTGAAGLAVDVYAGAGSVNEGSFLFAPGSTVNSLTSWTTVAPAALDVDGHGTHGVSMRIAVPTDAAPGEHYGVIWAQPRQAPASSGGVAVLNRVGIRVYLSVGAGGPPEASFSIDAVTAERDPAGRPIVAATVHNSGGRALDLSGALTLGGGPAGLSAGPFPAELGTTLAPGETEDVRFTLGEQVPTGPWDAVITLRSGLVEETATATISFPSAGAPPAVASIGGTWPAGWIALVLLLVGLSLAWVRLRAPRWRPAPDAATRC
jgi:hypothetical protein